MTTKGFDLGPLDFGKDDKPEKKVNPRRRLGPDPEPQPDGDRYSPWDDKTGEGWKGEGASDGQPPEGWAAALKETAERDFDDAFRALVVKFLWDMFFSFVKPSKESIHSIVKQIADVGGEQIVAQYASMSGGTLDEVTRLALAKAYDSSVQRFYTIFTTPMLDKEFMSRAREAFKKGIKK